MRVYYFCALNWVVRQLQSIPPIMPLLNVPIIHTLLLAAEKKMYANNFFFSLPLSTQTKAFPVWRPSCWKPVRPRVDRLFLVQDLGSHGRMITETRSRIEGPCV